jgi:hypothetical protein
MCELGCASSPQGAVLAIVKHDAIMFRFNQSS